MRVLQFLFTLLIFVNCFTHKSTQPTIQAEEMLIGKFDIQNLQSSSFAWYATENEKYKPKMEVVQMLKNLNNTYQARVFLGTWCSDSQREVPRFQKIISYLGLDASFVSYYGLNRQKKSLEGVENAYQISHVPTFIILENDKEIGRIVETPKQTLEEDLLKIVLKNPYTPNYAQ